MVRSSSWVLLALAMTLLAACSTAPTSQEARDTLQTDSAAALDAFKSEDQSLDQFFEKSSGYAIFPSIAKGAFGVGGAWGRGQVFEGDKLVGYCDVSQGTIGIQLGGQDYRELIFFETQEALDSFKGNTFELAAQASAVAVEAGASTTADYNHGVAIFTMAKAGLMYEASIGGQKFTYVPAQ